MNIDGNTNYDIIVQVISSGTKDPSTMALIKWLYKTDQIYLAGQ